MKNYYSLEDDPSINRSLAISDESLGEPTILLELDSSNPTFSNKDQKQLLNTGGIGRRATPYEISRFIRKIGVGTTEAIEVPVNQEVENFEDLEPTRVVSIKVMESILSELLVRGRNSLEQINNGFTPRIFHPNFHNILGFGEPKYISSIPDEEDPLDKFWNTPGFQITKSKLLNRGLVYESEEAIPFRLNVLARLKHSLIYSLNSTIKEGIASYINCSDCEDGVEKVFNTMETLALFFKNKLSDLKTFEFPESYNEVNGKRIKCIPVVPGFISSHSYALNLRFSSPFNFEYLNQIVLTNVRTQVVSNPSVILWKESGIEVVNLTFGTGNPDELSQKVNALCHILTAAAIEYNGGFQIPNENFTNFPSVDVYELAQFATTLNIGVTYFNPITGEGEEPIRLMPHEILEYIPYLQLFAETKVLFPEL